MEWRGEESVRALEGWCVAGSCSPAQCSCPSPGQQGSSGGRQPLPRSWRRRPARGWLQLGRRFCDGGGQHHRQPCTQARTASWRPHPRPGAGPGVYRILTSSQLGPHLLQWFVQGGGRGRRKSVSGGLWAAPRSRALPAGAPCPPPLLSDSLVDRVAEGTARAELLCVRSRKAGLNICNRHRALESARVRDRSSPGPLEAGTSAGGLLEATLACGGGGGVQATHAVFAGLLVRVLKRGRERGGSWGEVWATYRRR